MHVDLLTDPSKYRELIANGVTRIRDAGSAPPLDTLTRWTREVLAGIKQSRHASYHTGVSGPGDARHYVDSLRGSSPT